MGKFPCELRQACLNKNNDGFWFFRGLLYYSGFQLQVLIMSDYEKSKKVRRIASVIYLLIMAVIMGGTYLSQQQKEAAQKEAQTLKLSEETPGGFSETPTQNWERMLFNAKNCCSFY